MNGLHKVSRILFLVGAIVGVVGAGALFLSGVACIVLSLPFMDPYVEEIVAHMPSVNVSGDADAIIIAYRAIMISYAVLFIVLAVFMLLSGLFSFKARKEETKKLYIINIVFGVLGCNEVSLVAAILGLISFIKRSNRESKQEQAEVVDK